MAVLSTPLPMAKQAKGPPSLRTGEIRSSTCSGFKPIRSASSVARKQPAARHPLIIAGLPRLPVWRMRGCGGQAAHI
jgi:hypothetical protein